MLRCLERLLDSSWICRLFSVGGQIVSDAEMQLTQIRIHQCDFDSFFASIDSPFASSICWQFQVNTIYLPCSLMIMVGCTECKLRTEAVYSILYLFLRSRRPHDNPCRMVLAKPSADGDLCGSKRRFFDPHKTERDNIQFLSKLDFSHCKLYICLILFDVPESATENLVPGHEPDSFPVFNK